MMYNDYTDFIKELVKTKFPLFMKREWACVVEEILSTEKCMLTLADLFKFIDRCINCLDNPYCNDLGLTNSTESKAKPTPKKKMNFTSMINNSLKETGKAFSKNVVMPVKNVNLKFCLICNNTSHYLNQCFIFRKYSYPKRLQFVKDNALCFGCLSPGHIASNCKRQNSCCVCNENHTTLLQKKQKKSKFYSCL